MAAERDDIDPAMKGGTEPGIGPKAPASKPGGALPPRPATNGSSGAGAVDFDALHAALGEGSREAAPHGGIPVPAPPSPQAPAVKLGVAESQGRSSATYSSARPRSVPPAHVAADLGAPPVIVAQDDTIPGGPPQMTAPMGTPMTPMPMPMGPPSSGPYAAAPHVSSSPMMAASPMGPATPQSFAVQGRPMPGQPQLTMRMPERPRRPRTPTVVVRPRGPSTLQKLIVFAVMLLLVSACGIGIVMWRAPQLFGLGPKPVVTVTVPPKYVPPPQPTFTAAATATVSALPSVAPSASAAASAKPKTAKPAATPR